MDLDPEIPFQRLLDAMLDEETPLNPRFLYRLSDISEEDLSELSEIWPQVPVWRRQALFEDLEVLGESDFLLSYLGIGLLGLGDTDPKVRKLAVRLLWEYEDPELIPIFNDMLANDDDDEARAAAAGALGKYVYLGEVEELPEEILETIEDDLLDAARNADSPLVRRRALEALGFSSRSEVPPLIQSAYEMKEREWIASALFAMGRSANEEWEPHILAKFNSPHPIVRMEAARAAGELNLSESLEGLMEMLDDDNPDVRTAAIWSLSQIGGAGVRDLLEELTDEAENEEDILFLESALDNLSFTEDMQLFTIFDLPTADIKEAVDEDEEIAEFLLDEEFDDDEDLEYDDIDDEDLLD